MKRGLCLFFFLFLPVMALTYQRNDAVDFVKKYADPKSKPTGRKRYLRDKYHYYQRWDDIKKRWVDVNCSHFAHQAYNAGLGWSVTPGKLGNDWAPNHKNQRYHFNHDGTLPWCPEFQDLLIDEFRCPYKRWKSGNRPRTPQDTTFHTFPVLPGDIAFYCSTYVENGKEKWAKNMQW